MSYGADQAVRRVSGELRVGVEGDHVLHSSQYGKISHFDGEIIVLSAQEIIEVEQLPALPLPTHPCTLTRVVNTMAMEEEKGAPAFLAVPLVQILNQP